MNYPENYLKTTLFEFHRYKTLGEKTFEQLDEKEIHWKYGENDNSIAIIVKHTVGNMLSRWTTFLTEDGEKPWRHRETEFENAYDTKKRDARRLGKGLALSFCRFGISRFTKLRYHY